MATPKKSTPKKILTKKTVTKKTNGNMQKSTSMNDKLDAAARNAKGARYQLEINKAKGKSNTLDYRASTTATQRTKDLNTANSASKTLGRAKNIVSKEAMKVKKRKDILAGKAKYIN
jgi:hypothetical protein